MTKLSTAVLTEATVTWASKEFRTMVVTELVTPSWTSRFDVVAISPNTQHIKIFEVKRTRADFFRGKKENQFERYMDYCHQFYIVTPAGLLKKEEIPEGAGLIEIWETGTRRCTKRVARRSPLPGKYQMMLERVLQKLIVEGHRWSQETTWKQQNADRDRRWRFWSWLDQQEGRRPMERLRVPIRR